MQTVDFTDQLSTKPVSTKSLRRLGNDFRPPECTFAENDWEILAQQWFPIARVVDVQSAPVPVTLLDLELVVYRTSVGFSVARDLCPHRGVPLSMGCVAHDELVCTYHGLRFAPDGTCMKIPAQPELKPSSKFLLTTFPSIERYGLVWTCLMPQTGEPNLPPMASWDDPAYQAILPPFVDIAGSAGRQVEGFVDVAHFAFIHQKSFADRNQPEVPAYDTKLTSRGLRTEYWSNVSNYPKGLQHLAPPDFRWLRVFDIYPPFNAQLTVHFPNDGRLHILNAACPTSARKTRLFVPITRNFDTTGPLEDVYAFNAQIFAEDQAIVEHQRPAELPLETQAEAHFAADRTSVGYRRLLKEMGLKLAPIK
ncbi:aromatic ring-hydroxylating dioxygenase subunit alpha [Caballeronia mineralivorans]|jgi:phenylpropionate dioxygenase-like ring-hydroxylating dioxygenase large terminal subunit|uniref:aromatic ring-hydroxylating oxygenase subunit alpha n=1 Tax=Caballeronia mineralivorans TaxID=2010198 RepID=UPI0023F04B6D|nr:aromatic ring-hydroxylating dioxygenase subunit alpha [Caballeronia mineralivorans]MDB5783289.1 rieske [2Fe-2S] domain protein [Caballeronia mineralivorans]